MIRCGVDMIECDRIAAGIERGGERFLKRFLYARRAAGLRGQTLPISGALRGQRGGGKGIGHGHRRHPLAGY